MTAAEISSPKTAGTAPVEVLILAVNIDITANRTLPYALAVYLEGGKPGTPLHPYPQYQNTYHCKKKINKQCDRDV